MDPFLTLPRFFYTVVSHTVVSYPVVSYPVVSYPGVSYPVVSAGRSPRHIGPGTWQADPQDLHSLPLPARNWYPIAPVAQIYADCLLHSRVECPVLPVLPLHPVRVLPMNWYRSPRTGLDLAPEMGQFLRVESSRGLPPLPNEPFPCNNTYRQGGLGGKNSMYGMKATSGAKRSWWRIGAGKGAEGLFLEHLPLIERVATSAGRRAGFLPQDVEDFVSVVQLKLIDNDYEVLRRHRGESSLSTFLTTVIHNQLRDYRNHKWGKYRPSAAAKRLGADAVLLERLLVRDQHDLETAIQFARSRHRVESTAEELHQLAAQLPPRTTRHFVGEEALEKRQATSRDTHPEHRVEDGDRRTLAQRVEKTLDLALRVLPPQDLLILKMHFKDGHSLSTIARTLRLEQRPLYTRKAKSLKTLKHALATEGLTWEEVREILGWQNDAVHPHLFAADTPNQAEPNEAKL